MTQEEYLEFYDKYKENVLAIIREYHPYYRKKHTDVISAPGAEYGCEIAREQIRKENKEPDLETRDILAINKMCSDAWFGVPESMSSRELPGFFALCDLCSELPYDLIPEGGFDEED